MTTNASRAYAAAHFALELDNGQPAGMLRSIEGGGVKADVMTYQNGSSYDRWRQLGKPKFEDIKLQVGMSMSQPFYQWIEAFFVGKGTRVSGAIVAADFHYNERARREFSHALIKEIAFPKLDAADKNAAYMTVGLAVEDLQFKKGEGRKIQDGSEFQRQKLWTACNFRFSLDGLGDACRSVTKIDSFTIKQQILEYHAGGMAAPIKTPSQVDFPQLSFYLPEAYAQPLLERFYKRAAGREIPADGGRANGTLEVYDSRLDKALFALSFYGADIVNAQPDKSDASSEEIKLVKFDLSVERMEFRYHLS